jgi:hypothetical protein
MHIEYTVTLGDILTTLTVGGGAILFYTRIITVVNRWDFLMKEFPPHRHYHQHITYPKGMKPNGESSDSTEWET